MSILYFLLVAWVFYLLQVILINKYWNEKLSIDVSFKDSEIFEGESTELIEELRNSKWIPIWWLSLQIPISRYLIFSEEEQLKPRNNEFTRKDFFALLSYEKVRKRLKVTALKRGYYTINEKVLSSGDLFSSYRFVENRSCDVPLCVYPRLITTSDFKIFLNKLTGEVLTKRHIIDDPFTFRGIRDYNINDSLKLINWNATARSNEMKVNQYDYTASQQVLILLNTEKFNEWDPDILIEESIRLAATIASEYLEKGIQVGLISNSSDMFTGEEIRIEPKSGRTHLSLFFEALARLDEKKFTRPMKEIIVEERNKINRPYTTILISYYHGAELVEQFENASNGGLQIQWILPKIRGEEIKIESGENLFVWEVSEDERRIY